MKNIPNILSGIRILLIPLFVILMFQRHGLGAGIVLTISALTDVMDGFLARRFGWITDLGKVLDPVADKLTQATVCVVLAVLNVQYIAFFCIMIVKELIMVVFGGWLLKQGQSPVSARWFGKAATVVFYFTMCLLVFFPNLPQMVAYIMLGITTLLVLFAFVNYVLMFIKLLDTIKKAPKNCDGENAVLQ